MRALTAEEIRMVSEINEAAQGLDVIGKAKVLGFIGGLAAQVAPAEPPRLLPELMGIGAAQGAAI